MGPVWRARCACVTCLVRGGRWAFGGRTSRSFSYIALQSRRQDARRSIVTGGNGCETQNRQFEGGCRSQKLRSSEDGVMRRQHGEGTRHDIHVHRPTTTHVGLCDWEARKLIGGHRTTFHQPSPCIPPWMGQEDPGRPPKTYQDLPKMCSWGVTRSRIGRQLQGRGVLSSKDFTLFTRSASAGR